ncbi:3-keto-5-aminohexanoate cleavage protein [Halobaculum rubrum]|uniref:3-keto-5-aminohexanoate cleavage protein n=1 Tax=Halobaculum rubrum TaxID=2872158 RepID=UPI001CA3D95E|nr:3-keto-5-aminohexanoate cleavage protein [Halobaculum rubrum]QZX99567.1 3-keto-5-aminohexanoate cleavage protein [Halobaculum rubrum]
MTYEEYLDGNPVVITAALTGGIQGKEAHPDLPETPAEIAEAAAAVEEAGAAVVHLHARRDNGERAFSTERFQAVTDAVRDATEDAIVQHSTGGTAAPDSLRAEPLRTDPAPEMASLDMGPMNRGRRLTSENTRDTIDGLHAEMRERGIKPELEVFNNGHLNEAFRIYDDLADPPYLNLIFGPGTLAPPSPANLQRMVDQLPGGAEFNVIGFGPHQLPLTTQALILGGHVRVGLEDNSYLRKGELATNEALVARAARIAEELGRPVASPAEARDLLGVESRR